MPRLKDALELRGRYGCLVTLPIVYDEQAKMEASAKQLKEVMDKAFKETGVKVRQ